MDGDTTGGVGLGTKGGETGGLGGTYGGETTGGCGTYGGGFTT